MAPSDQYEDNDRLYLDDLYIGQRLTSRSHALDEAQIKAFAGQFACEILRSCVPRIKATNRFGRRHF
jgi:hypothetical protein